MNPNPNRNKKIMERTKFWNGVMVETHDLVVRLDYKMQDLADHFSVSKDTMSTVLHRRGLGLIRMRHNYKKEQAND